MLSKLDWAERVFLLIAVIALGVVALGVALILYAD